ncbi:MAG: S9 family peptidase [Candidatus Eisenbacteria sp.]|nr:S9 family peptidase [Candidatus Eisenbacteria bacterium]
MGRKIPKPSSRELKRRRGRQTRKQSSGLTKGGALTFTDLMAVERVSQPAVSPDGHRVAFVTTRVDHKENRTRHTIRLLDLRSHEIRDLTPGPGSHNQPAWSPDGEKLAFVSTRNERHAKQLWILPLAGGEAKPATSGYGGVEQPLWAPDSRRIAFTRTIVVSNDYAPRKGVRVDPHSGPAKAEVYGLVNRKSSARIADELLFRHWDSWRDRRRKHIFIVDTVNGKVADVTPHNCDAPPISLRSERDYDFSPAGSEIAFVMNPDDVVARSTNNSIFLQAIRGIKPVGEAVCISDSEACDCHPRYSANGSDIVYLAMEIPGYEADRNRIKLYNRTTKKTTVFLNRFDRNPSSFALRGSDDLIFIAHDRGRQSVYELDMTSGRVTQLTSESFNGLFRIVPGSKDLLVTRESSTEPADLYRLTPGKGIKPVLSTGPPPKETPLDAGATVQRLTCYGKVLSNREMNTAEEYWYPGADKKPIHGFLIRPPHFNSRQRYPLILLIHGGPQAAFADNFHYRWNTQLFAAQGVVVAYLNPRGSTGYGQKFTDQICGDWGGRCYQDLMLGVDFLLDRYRFIDGSRMAAAGASFGGFMINWIAGHTDRFRALVCHDGIFNAETMAYTTEELWFEEHEHGGMPHEKRQSFLKFSPHRFVQNFKTPTLVIQGEQDFRCPVSEGIGMFTALQTRGVPSRYVHFPDEGHWVQHPANTEVWYHEVIGWMMSHLLR